jgi:hypothetical protein
MQSETHTFFFLALPLTSGWVGGMTLGGNFLASSPNNKSTLCLWNEELGSSFFSFASLLSTNNIRIFIYRNSGGLGLWCLMPHSTIY